jgi:magnesium chelatase subunit I
LAAILARLGVGEDSVSPGQVAAAVEFVLEGLHLTRRLSKVQADGQTIYGS